MTSWEVRPSKGIAFFVGGAVLIAIALVGVAVNAFGLQDQAAGGNDLGLLRGLTIVGSAIAGGVGALLIAIGGVRRISASRRAVNPLRDPENDSEDGA